MADDRAWRHRNSAMISANANTVAIMNTVRATIRHAPPGGSAVASQSSACREEQAVWQATLIFSRVEQNRNRFI